MALIQCKECNKTISDLATTCPQCGAPNNAISLANAGAINPKSPLIPPVQRGTPECVSCNSRNTMRCSLAYAHGVNTKTLTGSAVTGGLGAGIVGGVLAPVASLGGIGLKGGLNSVSGLAQLCAPPTPPINQKLAVWQIALLCFFYPVGIYYFFFVHRPQRSKKEQAYAAAFHHYQTQELPSYQRKWICLDCGTINEFPEPMVSEKPKPTI